MKNLLLLLLLAVVVVVPGCSGGGSSSCSFSNLVANATYLVVINNPSAGTAITLTRVASSTGTLSIAANTSCSNVFVVLVTNANASLSVSPSSIDLENPPATVTITGSGFDTTYGMPRVEYFDATGFMVGSTNATSVWGGGTALECYVPGLYDAYSGTYQIRVTNKTSQGYYSARVGTVTVTAYGRDRYDSDGDGWYDDEDCDPYDPYVHTGCYCGGGQEPITVCN